MDLYLPICSRPTSFRIAPTTQVELRSLKGNQRVNKQISKLINVDILQAVTPFQFDNKSVRFEKFNNNMSGAVQIVYCYVFCKI